MITVVLEVRAGGLEVVDDPADGLDVGVLGLPLVMAAVVSALHDVHTTAEVWLLVHHPAEDGDRLRQDSSQLWDLNLNTSVCSTHAPSP